MRHKLNKRGRHGSIMRDTLRLTPYGLPKPLSAATSTGNVTRHWSHRWALTVK